MEQFSNLKNVQNKAGLKNLMNRGNVFQKTMLLFISICLSGAVYAQQTSEVKPKMFYHAVDSFAVNHKGLKLAVASSTGDSETFDCIFGFFYDNAAEFGKKKRTVDVIRYDFARNTMEILFRDEKGNGVFGITPSPKIEAFLRGKGINGSVIKIAEKSRLLTPSVAALIQYDEIAEQFFDNLAYFKKNGKYGYIDRTGKEIIPPKYDDAGNFSNNGLASVKLNGKCGYIDKTGKEVIPLKYDDDSFSKNYFGDDFRNGVEQVKLNGKYGYIDKNGKEIIPCQYDRVRQLANGYFWMEKNSKHGFFDAAGKNVIPVIYDEIEYDYSISSIYREKTTLYTIMIQIHNPQKYNSFLNRIKSFGCKLIDSSMDGGDIRKVYRGATTTFVVIVGTQEGDYSSTQTIYTISIMSNESYDAVQQ